MSGHNVLHFIMCRLSTLLHKPALLRDSLLGSNALGRPISLHLPSAPSAVPFGPRFLLLIDSTSSLLDLVPRENSSHDSSHSALRDCTAEVFLHSRTACLSFLISRDVTYSQVYDNIKKKSCLKA